MTVQTRPGTSPAQPSWRKGSASQTSSSYRSVVFNLSVAAVINVYVYVAAAINVYVAVFASFDDYVAVAAAIVVYVFVAADIYVAVAAAINDSDAFHASI